jgi:hypothetical protein
VTVTITYHRTCAHLEAPYSGDLNARIKDYHGTRWEGTYWSIPVRHVPDLADLLRRTGYDVVIPAREERAE